MGALMLRVGLTGSIAVGKSLVSSMLAELGCHVLDADMTAREVVAPGTPGLSGIVDAFGEGALAADKTLDRAKLAAIVFEDSEKRELLNSILHPLIIAAQDEQLRRWEAQDPNGIAVVDAALMIESGGFRRFDKLIVVHSRPEIQIRRLVARSGLSRAEAERRITSQMPQDEKMRHADFLVDNSGNIADTRKQVVKIHRTLRELANETAGS